MGGSSPLGGDGPLPLLLPARPLPPPPPVAGTLSLMLWKGEADLVVLLLALLPCGGLGVGPSLPLGPCCCCCGGGLAIAQAAE